MLVDETNRYAQQTIDSNPDQQVSWHPTNVPEMMAFVALLIAMGINKSSQYRMYWSTSDILHIPFYPSIMSRNRFSSILRFLHVSNNQMPRIASAKQDKLAKVRPLIAVLVPKFLDLYNPSQNREYVEIQGTLKFYSVHAEKTHQTGYESRPKQFTHARGNCIQELTTQKLCTMQTYV